MVAKDRVLTLSLLGRAGISGSDDDPIGPQYGVGRQAEHVADAGGLA